MTDRWLTCEMGKDDGMASPDSAKAIQLLALVDDYNDFLDSADSAGR